MLILLAVGSTIAVNGQDIDSLSKIKLNEIKSRRNEVDHKLNMWQDSVRSSLPIDTLSEIAAAFKSRQLHAIDSLQRELNTKLETVADPLSLQKKTDSISDA